MALTKWIDFDHEWKWRSTLLPEINQTTLDLSCLDLQNLLETIKGQTLNSHVLNLIDSYT